MRNRVNDGGSEEAGHDGSGVETHLEAWWMLFEWKYEEYSVLREDICWEEGFLNSFSIWAKGNRSGTRTAGLMQNEGGGNSGL
jgi:hypothetical protein